MKANWFSKTLGASALAMALGGPAMAGDFANFTINETSVAGCTAAAGCNTALVADRLNGLFTETFSPTFLTATSGTFTTTATFNISSYYNNDVLVSGALGCGLAPCYDLYAQFQAGGTFNTVGGQTTFTGTSGAFQLYVDPNQDDKTGAIIGAADDRLLANATGIFSGRGQFTGPPDTGNPNGNFEIIFTPVNLVAPDGTNFFTAPRPFYLFVDANGNFTENPLTNFRVSGSANAFFFSVPEPNTLLLLGIAVLGAGIVARRRT